MQRVGGVEGEPGVLPVVALAHGRFVFPAQSEVNGQLGGDAPVILHEEALVDLLESRGDGVADPPPEGQPSSSDANGLPAVALPVCAFCCVNPALKLNGLMLDAGVLLLAFMMYNSPPALKLCLPMVLLRVPDSEWSNVVVYWLVVGVPVPAFPMVPV